MDKPGTRINIHGLLALLALQIAPNAMAGNDRLFANGFDPCCQLGGTVTGLSGGSLVLHLSAGAINENRSIARNGPYRFAASIPPGTAYTVSIDTQPNGQSCGLANATGTMGSTSIDTADASCGASPDLIWNQGNWGQDWQ